MKSEHFPTINANALVSLTMSDREEREKNWRKKINMFVVFGVTVQLILMGCITKLVKFKFLFSVFFISLQVIGFWSHSFRSTFIISFVLFQSKFLYVFVFFSLYRWLIDTRSYTVRKIPQQFKHVKHIFLLRIHTKATKLRLYQTSARCSGVVANRIARWKHGNTKSNCPPYKQHKPILQNNSQLCAPIDRIRLQIQCYLVG